MKKKVDALGQEISNGDIILYPRYSRNKPFNIAVINDENFNDEIPIRKRIFIANRHLAMTPTYLLAFHRAIKLTPGMLDMNNKWHMAVLQYSLHLSKQFRY